MKVFWIIAGWIALVLGGIGALLPVIPTTPFLLVAAFCFSRGSERMHRWLLSLPHFGPAIHDWEKNKVIRPPAKRAATFAIAVMFGSTFIFAKVNWAVKGSVIAIGILILVFIWTRRSEP